MLVSLKRSTMEELKTYASGIKKEEKQEQTVGTREKYESKSQPDSKTPQDNSWFYTTQHTNYHYSRRDCSQLFKVRILMGESAFDVNQSNQTIQKRLGSLMNFGYYVKRLSKMPEKRFDPQTGEKIKDIKFMRRKVKLRFRCTKCAKNFTSIVGLFQIMFNINVINKKNAGVYFKCRIYKMQCQSCRKYCHGKIYESQLRAVTKGFYLLITEIMEGIEPPQHVDRRHKMNQDAHDHKEQFCQACIKGVCFARQKGETEIKESSKQVKQEAQIQN